MSANSGSYTALPISESQVSEEYTSTRAKFICCHGTCDSLLLLMCLSTVFSSILSLVIFIPKLNDRSPLPQQLRRPSTYINLDSVVNSTNKFQASPPIVNFASAVFQYKKSILSRSMFEDDSRRYNTPEGMAYPDDRHFLVSHKISTIMQFRGIDFGMERCVLTAQTPSHTRMNNPEVKLLDGSMVDVWELDSSAELLPFISWGQVPPRIRHFTTITFDSRGGNVSKAFPCKSGLFSTFEFACSKHMPDCNVDFWQVKEKSPGGVYAMQYDSISP